MIFKLRFAAQILTSMVTLTLITPSFASSHMAYQQPSYGDNPNLMRVLLYKTKHMFITPKQALGQPIRITQAQLSAEAPSMTQSKQILEKYIVSLPLTPSTNYSSHITTQAQAQAQAQAKSNRVNLTPLSTNNIIHIPELVDLSRLNVKEPRIIIEQIPTEIEDDYFSSQLP